MAVLVYCETKFLYITAIFIFSIEDALRFDIVHVSSNIYSLPFTFI